MSAIAYTAIGNTMPYITVFNKQVNKGFNTYLFLILNTRLNAGNKKGRFFGWELGFCNR